MKKLHEYGRWDRGPGWRYTLKWRVWGPIRFWIMRLFGYEWCDHCEAFYPVKDMGYDEMVDEYVCDGCCSAAWDREQERLMDGSYELSRISYMDSIDRQCAEAGRPSPFGN